MMSIPPIILQIFLAAIAPFTTDLLRWLWNRLLTLWSKLQSPDKDLKL